MIALHKSLAIRLLVISNVVVAAAAASQGLSLFLPAIIAYSIAFSLAIVGAGFAIWQGMQAGEEQRQEVEKQIKFERDVQEAKERDKLKTWLLLAVGILLGATLYYWRHPEKRPKS